MLQKIATMKILQIAPKIPFPFDDGSKVSIFNLTDQLLKRGVEVCFAAPSYGKNPDEQFTSMVRYVPIDIDGTYSIAGGIRNLFSSMPYNIEKYFDSNAFKHLSRLHEESKFDLVHVDHLHMAEYGLKLKEKFGTKIILREHNFESDILRRVAERTKNPVTKSYYKLQYSRILRYESHTVAKFDAVLPISDVDNRKLRALSPGVNSFVIPAGVEIEKFLPNRIMIRDRVLFLSSYDWLPNMDSLQFYVEEILPLLNEKAPLAKTVVAGKSVDRIPKAWLNGSFENAGFVADFNRLASTASVAVVPLRIGSGMRIKILELMALGMAIVSTSIGAEGIDVEDGKHLMLADTPREFAERVATLLSSPDLCKEIGTNARELVSEKYTWDSAGEKLLNVYKNIVGGDDVRD